jgi:hypothetical protein
MGEDACVIYEILVSLFLIEISLITLGAKTPIRLAADNSSCPVDLTTLGKGV